MLGCGRFEGNRGISSARVFFFYCSSTSQGQAQDKGRSAVQWESFGNLEIDI